MAIRTILHCDCNSYFASVEAMLDPSLKGIPLAVAGDPKSRHGVVVAASQEAKKFGVRTTDTVYAAKKKCPELVVVVPHHGRYSEVSEMINRIYLEYTDLVEPFSVDESFLDLTGSPALRDRTGKEIADELRFRIKQEIGITISVGVSQQVFREARFRHEEAGCHHCHHATGCGEHGLAAAGHGSAVRRQEHCVFPRKDGDIHHR